MLTTLNIFLVFFLVLANGFFVASEFALVGVRRSRIATLAENGDKRAQRLLGLVDNLNAYISATQLGITLALGWIGEPAVARLCCKNYFGTRKVVKRFLLRCDLKEIQDKLCLPLRIISA